MSRTVTRTRIWRDAWGHRREQTTIEHLPGETVLLVLPDDAGVLEAAEYDVYDVDRCRSPRCAGEARPMSYDAAGTARCLACDTIDEGVDSPPD